MKKRPETGIKKVLFVAVLGVVTFATNAPAQAREWIRMGNGGDYEYYFDADGEVAEGPYWAAPALAITPEGSEMRGAFLVNCSNRTYRARFDGSTSDWSLIGANSPLDRVVENVCVLERSPN